MEHYPLVTSTWIKSDCWTNSGLVLEFTGSEMRDVMATLNGLPHKWYRHGHRNENRESNVPRLMTKHISKLLQL